MVVLDYNNLMATHGFSICYPGMAIGGGHCNTGVCYLGYFFITVIMIGKALIIAPYASI